MYSPSPCLSGKQSRAGHALQFVNIRRLLRSCPNAVLEYAFLKCAEKFPCNRELCLLRRVEPAVCRPPLFHDGNGFLAGQTNGEGQRSAVTPRLVNWQRLHEPEHARDLQIRKLSAPKFPVVARAPRHHLSATASRYSSARRHFLLYVSFSLLHARHLSRRFEADEVAARFHPGRFLFSSAGRRPNCASRRFSSTTCQAAEFARGPVFLGIGAYDSRFVRKN